MLPCAAAIFPGEDEMDLADIIIGSEFRTREGMALARLIIVDRIVALHGDLPREVMTLPRTGPTQIDFGHPWTIT